MSAEQAREYIAWAEADVPKDRTFEDWHDKGTVLLREVLDERDAAIRRAEDLSAAAEKVVAMRRTIGRLTPGVLDELEAALRSQESQKPPPREVPFDSISLMDGPGEPFHHPEPPETER